MRFNERPHSDGGSATAFKAGPDAQHEHVPARHIARPGRASELWLKPRFMAPHYEGSNKLKHMSALITGADSGIGRAVAVVFAREGADVAIVYLDSHEDAEHTKTCVEAEGQRCLLIAGDVKDTAFCRQAVERTLDTFGRLDVLVNNAVFQQPADALEDISEARLDETFRTNIYGYFRAHAERRSA